MSERREHKRRYNQKLEFIEDFERWLKKEPPHAATLLAVEKVVG